jgi:hypothetical protein
VLEQRVRLVGERPSEQHDHADGSEARGRPGARGVAPATPLTDRDRGKPGERNEIHQADDLHR